MNPLHFFRQPDLKLEAVDLGNRTVRVPFVRIEGTQPGPTMVVTGGMDGDEYPGILAAYEIVRRYAGARDAFHGTLVVLPIVNVPGWENESSNNPDDRQFPKYFYPGKPEGRPTERLVSWLIETHVRGTDAWYDLHSGAITEGLQPFPWTWNSGVKRVDELNAAFIARTGAAFAMNERASPTSKAGALAREGCWYVLAESGARASTHPDDVALHVRWVEDAMAALGMLDRAAPAPTATKVLREVTYLYAKDPGVWELAHPFNPHVRKGTEIGRTRALDRLDGSPLLSPCDGEALWWKETPSMRHDDILCAIGH